MKLTLVNIEPRIYPPLGLVYVASYLREHLEDIDVTIVEADKGVTKKILRTKPDFVGFTATTSEYNDIMLYAKELKEEDPSFKILIGGSHITSLPDTLSKYIDFGIVGEGEKTALELLSNDRHKEIKGLCYHSDGVVKINPKRPFIRPLDDIPNPARDLLDMKGYLKPSNLFYTKELHSGTTMLTSRGCLFKCVYCQVPRSWNGLRLHTPEYIVNEMIEMCDKYRNIRAINIVDDIFAFNEKRLSTILALMKKTGFLSRGIIFNINSRSDLLNDAIFRLLKEVGVKQIGIGFESCSERVLCYLKGDTVTVQQNKDVFKLAEKYNIAIGGQFMFGSPNETMDDMEQTRTFIQENLHRLAHAHISVTTPLPETVLWDYAKERGIISQNIDWNQFRLGFNPISDKEIPFYLADAPKDEFLEFMDSIYREVARINPTGGVDFSLATLKKVLRDPYKAIKYLRWLVSK